MNPHSELRAVEGRLRDGLRDPSWPGRTPDADALLHQIARARRRRPVLVAACLAILVIAAVSATYAVAGRSQRAAPPASTPTPTGSPSPLPSDLAMIWPAQVYFADAQHGFVVLKTCAGVPTPSPDPAGGPPVDLCPVYVAATDDGGQSWRPRAVPGATASNSADLVTNVLLGADADHLLLERQVGGSLTFSRDGGRTWTDLSNPVGTLDEVPPGGLAAILFGRTGPSSQNLMVIRPDGVTARLARPPVVSDQAMIADPVGVAADGSLWVTAVAEGLPTWDYVSRDHGRTWLEVRGPAGAGVILRTSGPNLFATDDQKHTLWTSKDGQHWDPVALPFPTTGLATRLLYEPRNDGSLLVGDPTQGRTYVLAEATLRFTEVPVDEHMFAQHVGAGCIKSVRSGAPFVLGVTQPSAYDFAPDCVHWRRFPFAVA